MKQPKFRGYSTETNSWHYGHGWFEVGYTEEYKQQKGINDRARLYTDGYPEECELSSMGVSTDLKDKYGIETFEGDVVTVYHLGFRTFNAVVKYGEYIQDGSGGEYGGSKCIGFYVEAINPEQLDEDEIRIVNDYLVTNSLLEFESFEVIGNIYENPELLEGSK